MLLASFVDQVIVAPFDVMPDEETPLMTGGVVSGGGATGLTVRDALLDTLLYEPESETLVEVETLLVDTVKLAVSEPAGTVTLVGPVATLGFVLDSETTAPLDGAGADKVTVP